MKGSLRELFGGQLEPEPGCAHWARMNLSHSELSDASL
jgi:hypothetical protein